MTKCGLQERIAQRTACLARPPVTQRLVAMDDERHAGEPEVKVR